MREMNNCFGEYFLAPKIFEIFRKVVSYSDKCLILPLKYNLRVVILIKTRSYLELAPLSFKIKIKYNFQYFSDKHLKTFEISE